MTITLKSEADLAKMRVAGRLAADVLDMIAPYIVPGASTAELDRRCHDYITNVQQAIPACLNYGSPPFPASTCISVNHVICHGIPSDTASAVASTKTRKSCILANRAKASSSKKA